MFTKAVARLEDARSYVDHRLIEILQEAFGHCQQALAHRGDVTLPGMDIRQEPRPGTAAAADQLAKRGLLFPVIQFGDNAQVRGVHRWARVIEAPREVERLGVAEWWAVSCPYSDRFDTNPQGRLDVYLGPVISGEVPVLDVGDNFGFTYIQDRSENDSWMPAWTNERWDTEAGTAGFIDVVVCRPWNRCGSYLVFPQKRIYYDSRGHITSIVDLPPTVVPIYVCESSDPPPSSDQDPPSDSSCGSSSAGEGWTDDDIVFFPLVVEGDLTPAGAAGNYSRGYGYYNGRPFWYMYGEVGTFLIWWDPSGAWIICEPGEPDYRWYKKFDINTPLGDYTRYPSGDGVATVTEGGLP